MKCEQYWPMLNCKHTYGDVSLTNINEDANAEYTETFPLQSAGVGRTGTYIALDILTEEGEDKGQIDLFICVLALRFQRVSMVQTPEQYIFLHKAVVHTLLYESKAIQANEFLSYTSNISADGFQQAFELLSVEDEYTEVEKRITQLNEANFTLNRPGADIPGSRFRVHLYKYQSVRDNNYVNAVYIDSFKTKNRFITTQTPLPATVVDFLKLIVQEECTCIINLEPETLQVKSLGKYMPPDGQSVTLGPFRLNSKREISSESYSLHQLRIVHEGQRDRTEMRVLCFQFNFWTGKANTPEDPATFLSFIKDVKDKLKEHQKGYGPMIVHCLSGSFKCGLFCAAHNAIEKIENEQQVSINNIVRQIRHRRKSAIMNKDQLKFCYESVCEYLNSCNTYTNVVL